MPNWDDEILTPEACQILKIDRSTVTRWVADGKLVPIRKLPGRTGAYLFSRRAVRALRDELDAEPSGALPLAEATP